MLYGVKNRKKVISGFAEIKSITFWEKVPSRRCLSSTVNGWEGQGAVTKRVYLWSRASFPKVTRLIQLA